MREENLERLADLIKKSNKTVVLTGAGMSTESGIPDFRSKSGWWKQIDPRTVATVEALEQNYSLFHEFYRARIKALENCEPHEGHYILAKWENEGQHFTIATQNVDGFHQKAGNMNVDELHGSIRSIRCQKCGNAAEMEAFLEMKSCHLCDGKLRPNVVLFGESLPDKSWTNAMNNIKNADLVIVIGTSLEVYPVNQLPNMTLGKTVYINLDVKNQLDTFDLIIKGKARETLEKLDLLLDHL